MKQPKRVKLTRTFPQEKKRLIKKYAPHVVDVIRDGKGYKLAFDFERRSFKGDIYPIPAPKSKKNSPVVFDFNKNGYLQAVTENTTPAERWKKSIEAGLEGMKYPPVRTNRDLPLAPFGKWESIFEPIDLQPR